MGLGQMLRDTLKRGETIVAPAAYDAITGRVAQYLGFKAIYQGGFQTGASYCLPEALTTMTEFVQTAWAINSGTRGELAIIVDAGICFGEPSHLVRTIREFEAAGVAGVHIEDEVGPRRTSLQKPAHTSAVVPINQFVDRLKYAIDTRKDGDMFIIARTNGYKSTEGGTREGAVERLLAAIEVGVDAVYVDGAGRRLPPKEAKEEYLYFRKAIPAHIPIMALGGAGGLSVQEFEQVGHKIIVYPGTTIVSAIEAVYRAYKGLKEKGRPTLTEVEENFVITLRHELCRFPEYWAIEDATTLTY